MTEIQEQTPTVTADSTVPPLASPVTPVTRDVVSDPAVRFRGIGTNFKAKLIGIDDVTDSRGDRMCQESILKLKAAVKASGQHKQKIIINVSLEGIKIVDVLSGEVHHVHPVHRISFISRDLTDRRAFGYVFGAGDGKHQFFGIKTAKVAEVLVLALRDLFQVVYDMKKKEMETKNAKEVQNGNESQRPENVYAVPHRSDVSSAKSLPAQQSNGSLLDLEQQLTNIQEGINNIDSFSPWPQDGPTSPDTPGLPEGSSTDLWGIENLSDISSLSSDFSCASNSVLDYGHAGGGNLQFQRSGSSRSETSWQGSKISRPINLRSSSSSARSKGSVTEILPSKYTPPTMLRNNTNREESGMTTAEEKSVVPDKVANEIFQADNTESSENAASNKLKRSSMRRSRDTLQQISSTEGVTDKKQEVKKSSSPGFFSRRSKKLSKKSKAKKDKGSNKYKNSKSDDEKTSSLELPEKSTSIAETGRTESISSGASVQSCVVLSSSQLNKRKEVTSSLNNINDMSKTLRDSSHSVSGTSHKKLRSEKSTPPLPSYIIPSSVCSRPRPRAKHSDRVSEAENNPRNPPMFKSHSTSPKKTETELKELSRKKSNSEKPESNVSGSNVPMNSPEKDEEGQSSVNDQNKWGGSFETDFDSFREKNLASNSSEVDPFTGEKPEKLSSSVASNIFEDAAWDSEPLKTSSTFESDPTTAFSNSLAPTGAEYCGSDPFLQSNTDSPFDGIDPFGEIVMNDPLADPFSPFEEQDVFDQNTLGLPEDRRVISDNSCEKHDCTDCNSDTDVEVQKQSLHQPTFPPGSEKFSVFLNDVKHQTTTSADSSSLTSGMSTPVLQSPVHQAVTPPTTSNYSSKPPPLPPRLPPRPPKVMLPSPLVVDNGPNIPPPPLPEGCNFSTDDEDEETTPPDFLPPELPLKFRDVDETDACQRKKTVSKLPPAIPKRTHSRESSLNLDASFHLNPRKRSHEASSFHDSSSSFSPEEGFPEYPQSSNGANRAPPDSSYSDQLFELGTAIEPAPQPGAKLTNNQIMMGFGGGQPAMTQQQQMFSGQPGMMMPPGQYGMQGQMQQGYAQQPVPGFAQAPATSPPFGVFPAGPGPAVPPRPGAMRLPTPQIAPGGATQNPFGDATGNVSLLAPMNKGEPEQPTSADTSKKDPFASLIPGMGAATTTNKQEMFKNFQMAKPPQPPPRSNLPQNAGNGSVSTNPEASATPKFENYLLNSEGGVPVLEEDFANGSSQARQQAASTNVDDDPFGMGSLTSTGGFDDFNSNAGFNQPFDFNQTSSSSTNVQSLFG